MRSLFLLVSSLLIVSFKSARVNAAGDGQHPVLKRIIIDAGHGGHDVGALGRFSKEKDVSLAVALKLGTVLQKALPNVEIVQTRTSDIFHSPVTKANIANNNKGDLFISIHCNAAPAVTHSKIIGYKTQTYYTGKGKNRKKHIRKVPQYQKWTSPNPAKGTETYIWGSHKTDDKQNALRENEALYLDSATANFVQDFDPNSPEKMILYSLKTQQYFNRSAQLALSVEEEFTKVGRISREARQRQVGIYVLQAVAMPSILVETGFITNPEEEKYINSAAGQQEIVECITRAVKRYKQAIEQQSAVLKG